MCGENVEGKAGLQQDKGMCVVVTKDFSKRRELVSKLRGVGGIHK